MSELARYEKATAKADAKWTVAHSTCLDNCNLLLKPLLDGKRTALKIVQSALLLGPPRLRSTQDCLAEDGVAQRQFSSKCSHLASVELSGARASV